MTVDDPTVPTTPLPVRQEEIGTAPLLPTDSGAPGAPDPERPPLVETVVVPAASPTRELPASDPGDRPTLWTRLRRLTSPDRTVTYGWSPHPALSVAAVLTGALLWLNVAVSAESAQSWPEWLRSLLVIAGATVLPGLPIVILLRIPGRALAAVLTVAVSLSTLVLAAQFTMVTDHWEPVRTQTAILVASAVLIAASWLTLARNRRTGVIGWRRDRWTRLRAGQLAALAASVGLLVLAARGIEVLDLWAVGVLSQVGPIFVIGLILLAWVIVSALRARRLDPLVLSAATVVTVVYNTMLLAFATGHTAVPNSFVHRGFIAIIDETHRLPTAMDARFSWAGFFTGATHMQIVADLPDVTSWLAWSPVYFNVLLSFGLYAIAIAITGRARLAWIAVLIYHGFNWYQQDYFAPQAVALIGYTAVAGTMLWQLRAAPFPRLDPASLREVWWRTPLRAISRTPGRVPGFGPVATLAIGGVLLVIITANVISHQMTPILLVLSLFAFAVTGTTRYRTLWLAAGLIFAAWFSYGASEYWIGHLQSLLDEIGQVGNSVNKGVAERLTGDPLYQRMQYLRMAAAGGLVLLGGLGGLLWLGKRKRALWVGAALCAAPGGLIVLQSYGGEMIIRAFLLAAPTVAPFAAMALAVIAHQIGKRLRARGIRPARVVVTAFLVAAVTVVGLVETTNRGLNASFEASSPGEVDITAEMMRELPPNVAIMTFSYAPHTIGIRRGIDPTGPLFGYIDSYPCLNDLAACALDRNPDYLYITSQGIKMIHFQFGRPATEVRKDIHRILDSGQYLVNVDTETVLILRRSDAAELNLTTADAAPSERSLK